jgi:hypothetical protein
MLQDCNQSWADEQPPYSGRSRLQPDLVPDAVKTGDDYSVAQLRQTILACRAISAGDKTNTPGQLLGNPVREQK